MQERRDQLQSLRLSEWLDPFNAAARSFLDQVSGQFPQQTGDPSAGWSRLVAASNPAQPTP